MKESESGSEGERGIPYLFRCPISLDLLTDPVTLCTGQTYERSSIEKWLSVGTQTCPVTMQKLHDPSMVPNHTLRHLIHQWRLQSVSDSDSNYHHPLIASDSDRYPFISSLKHILQSHDSSLEDKLQTLETIQILSPSCHSCLIELGFFPLLLQLVFGAKQNLKLVEQALVCALKLLPHCSLRPLKDMFKEESIELDNFVAVFNQGTITIKKSLCEIVEAISSSLETKELCAMLGNNQRLLRGMVLLLYHQDNSGASESGIKAMSPFCSLEANRGNLVRQGVVDGLITYILWSGHERQNRNLGMAMAMLEVLLGLESAKQAVIDHPSGVNVLVKMVFRVSDDCHQSSESSVNSLMMLCCDSVQAREAAICAGVLTQLLLLLQSQCGGTTKTKARMLLKLLRSTHHV
ncbi:U-box domain-containing protein 25-like [Actinidia eriantha]|uniref:U-box domain-containing protein 25-like n=1 Tax=Actinidia eriantha TaxID=165200 RepID=UPI0025865486|nr:U-box domain-containing protein 25-like [Actinidia eriantha]